MEFTDLSAITVVVASTCLLAYFSWKTLITSNSFQKGVKLYQQKDYPGAEAAFREVIAINTTNDVVRLLLGDTLMQQDKLDEATEIFTSVTRSSPKNPDAYLRLAQALIEQEKPQEAIPNLKQARDLFQKQRKPEKAAQISEFLQKIGE